MIEVTEKGAILTVDGARGYFSEAFIISALKKQLPKKINITASGAKEIVDGVYVLYKCPECGNKIASGFYYPPYNDILKSHEFCESCGQKIDWSDK